MQLHILTDGNTAHRQELLLNAMPYVIQCDKKPFKR